MLLLELIQGHVHDPVVQSSPPKWYLVGRLDLEDAVLMLQHGNSKCRAKSYTAIFSSLLPCQPVGERGGVGSLMMRSTSRRQSAGVLVACPLGVVEISRHGDHAA